MKIGVPIFGYQNFPQFEKRIAETSHFTANLGDNVQSIAIRSLLQRLGVSKNNIVSINRDALTSYNGEPVALVMNGVFPIRCFPTPPEIRPIFIGLCVDEKTVSRFREYFAQFQPIGCRDTYTKELFDRYGVMAFVSGCLSMTLLPRIKTELAKKTLIVYGSGAGVFPSSLLSRMPSFHFQDAEFIFHRLPLFEVPLSEKKCMEVERYAHYLLDYYATHAKIVVTPLHHVAAPCMALGIPVIICREQMDSRFSYLSELTPVYTPETFNSIDWNPAPVEMNVVRIGLEKLMRTSLNELRQC